MLCKFLWQSRTTTYGIHAYEWFLDQDALVCSFQSQYNSVNCPTVICSPNTCSFAWRVTTSETLNPSPSFIIIAFVVTIALITAATTLLLLCGGGDWGSLKRLHPSTHHYFLSPLLLLYLSSAFSGVVELTTQLLRLISILWLPLCRIDKLGYTTLERLSRSPTLVGYQQPPGRALWSPGCCGPPLEVPFWLWGSFGE